MSKQLKADLMLVLVTLCWGLSYIFVNMSLEQIPPLLLNAYRFLIAFVVALPLIIKDIHKVSKTTLKFGMLIGLLLSGVYMSVTYGLMYTSVSNAGFLCAMTVIFTPIFLFFVKGERPQKKLYIVLLLCLIGIGLMTLDDNLKPRFGDILCIMCAVFYAIDLIVTDHAVHKTEVNPIHLGVIQLGFTGTYMLIASSLLEEPAIPQTIEIWGVVLFLAIFCTGLAFIVQVIAQQHTTATHVGIIFTLEPVFSAIAAYVFVHEVLRPRGYVGAVLMIVGILLMEVDIKGIVKKLFIKS